MVPFCSVFFSWVRARGLLDDRIIATSVLWARNQELWVGVVSGCSLGGCSLGGCSLGGCSLGGCSLGGCSLGGCSLGGCSLGGCSLGGVWRYCMRWHRRISSLASCLSSISNNEADDSRKKTE